MGLRQPRGTSYLAGNAIVLVHHCRSHFFFASSQIQWKKLSASRTGDSPLSTLGHQQAQETGKFLDSWLTEKGFSVDDITWMSSPFLRCVQTSDDALNSFRQVDVHTLPILPEYSIFEWDGHGGEWHQDLPSLEERKHYFPRLDVNYESSFIPTLPGTYVRRETDSLVFLDGSQSFPFDF
jgi:broad specificity phosphatase PhoE